MNKNALIIVYPKGTKVNEDGQLIKNCPKSDLYVIEEKDLEEILNVDLEDEGLFWLEQAVSDEGTADNLEIKDIFHDPVFAKNSNIMWEKFLQKATQLESGNYTYDAYYGCIYRNVGVEDSFIKDVLEKYNVEGQCIQYILK